MCPCVRASLCSLCVSSGFDGRAGAEMSTGSVFCLGARAASTLEQGMGWSPSRGLKLEPGVSGGLPYWGVGPGPQELKQEPWGSWASPWWAAGSTLVGGLAGAHACWQWRCLPQRRAEGLGDMLGQIGQAGQSTGQFPSCCLHAGTGSQDVCAHSSFFKFIYFSWRLITLQYCSGFCPTLIGISHGCTCVPHPEPPSHLPPHPIPQGHPSAPALSTLSHASNLDWRSVSYMIICMFQCYSLRSSPPRLLFKRRLFVSHIPLGTPTGLQTK